ncbi:MAG: hypothetical protein PHC97_01740 [Patescibacteria group bacterium]|nr:hypothetical protein [Patescibacteria group bacterium]
MPEIFEKFYAVTGTSIYEVYAKDENGHPYAVKIELKGESKVQKGERVNGGTMLAIATNLQFYINEGRGLLSPQTSFERRLEYVNTGWWRGGTSKIVALFLNEQEARCCFEEPDLKPCDPRWLVKTKEVIEKIGEEHPTISICHYPELCLVKTD